MANSAFSKIVKSLWVLVAFIPIINGLGFAYIGAKEFNNNWIKEALIYELPWFLEFLFLFNDGLASFFAGIGLVLMLVCIIRTFMVYFKHKDILIDDDDESRIDVEKSARSYWVIFSFIIFLNGLGLIFVGMKGNIRRWILEGAIFELLWVLYFILFSLNEGIGRFILSLAMIGWVLSIIRTFMVYFEEEKMDNANYSIQRPIAKDTDMVSPKTEGNTNNQSSNLDIIPQFRSYNSQINDLKNTFNKKESDLKDLINKRFNKEELTYDRFMSVIDNCHKLFYHQADSASSIIHLAPEYSERLDETVKDKISILEGIIEEMNNLIEEFIIHDASNQQSEEDLNELFANMDNLISSVKDYK